MRANGKSEFDDGSDLRTPLQEAYGAGEPEGDTFAGLDPIEEARRRLAAKQKRS